MREWEIGAVENIHGALPYIRFAPLLALVGVGVTRIGKDPSYATAKGRSENRASVILAIENLLMTQSTEHWVARLQPLGLVIAGVQDMASALESDLTSQREMIRVIETEAGDIRVAGNPIKGDGVVWRATPPPKLGQHIAVEFGGRS